MKQIETLGSRELLKLKKKVNDFLESRKEQKAEVLNVFQKVSQKLEDEMYIAVIQYEVEENQPYKD